MKKTIVIVMIFTLFSKVIGFLRDIILAYFYGASSISDAFLISLVIPSVIFGFIGTGVYSAFIPLHSKIEKEFGTKEGDNFTNNLINLLLLVCTFLFIVCMLFTEPLVKIFASGFTGETLNLAVSFTKITIISIYFTALIYVFNGYLQLKGNHIAIGLMGLPLNFALILAIFMSSYVNIFILPMGKVLAVILQLVFLIYFAYKKGYSYKPILKVKSKYLKRMGYLSFPVILSSSVDQINSLVDRTIASGIAIGGISALNYANQLNLFVQGIFVTSIAVVFYPLLSKMAAEHNILGVKKSLSQAIIIINVLLVPATVGTIIFAGPIVDLLFGRGAFSNDALIMTSTALFYYSFGMLFFGLREVLNKAFYSLQDTRTPMINSVMAVSLNIILNIILSKYMGVGGLALATSISACVCTLLLFISLGKKIGYYELTNMYKSLLKIICISLFMGISAKITYFLMGYLFYSHVSLLISVAVGVFIYMLLIYFMRIKEVDEFVLGLRKKMGNSLKAG